MAKTRNQIDPKFQWKLEDIYASDDRWEKEFSEAEKLAEQIKTSDYPYYADACLQELMFRTMIYKSSENKERKEENNILLLCVG